MDRCINNYKFFIAVLILFCVSNIAIAQIPPNYYNNANGSGNALKLKLHNIVTAGHIALGYNGTWSAFSATDVKPNGKLWDIYSYKFVGAQPYEYTLITSQCGAYSKEGDCYNREHTWPQTFFNSAEPARSDLHQLFPTDGFINGMHASLPYADVNNVSKTSLNGCKLGTGNAYGGYFGDVFEIIDSFKGDIARAYFYMNIRYHTDDAGWTNWEMANGAELTVDALTLLRTWHNFDPVSKKEIDRNNEIYKLQGNRNPFIDYPIYVDCIWGNTTACNGIAIDNTVYVKPTITYLPNANLLINNFNNEKIIAIKVLSINGQIINVVPTDSTEINTLNLNTGLYLLQIVTKQGVHNYKFVK